MRYRRHYNFDYIKETRANKAKHERSGSADRELSLRMRQKLAN